MKTLVVYFSRTNTTKKVADELSKGLNCEIEELKDTKNRSGVIGYLSAGRDASLRKLTALEPLKNDIANYDLILVGTPVWSWNISVPVRTFLTEYKEKIKNVAFFCTMGGSGADRTFAEMESISGKAPLALMQMTTKEVVAGNFSKKINDFINNLSK
jgi:flavodoxin